MYVRMGRLVAGLGTLALTIGPHPQAPLSRHFESEVHSFELQDLADPPPQRPMLFVGSSSIRLWHHLTDSFPEWSIMNRGFGGSQMADLLGYFPRLVTRYQPRILFVYEGDNDLSSGKSVELVESEFKRFLDRCQGDLPGNVVILLAVKPSPLRRSLLASQKALNAFLASLASPKDGIFFLDMSSPLLDSRGEPRPELFQKDQLHLNASGYAIWANVIRGFLKERCQMGDDRFVL